jgi:molybdate transport system substrate-binding protein
MTIHRTAGALAGLLLSLVTAQAQAAELKVLASTAIKGVLEELGPQFEKATGNKVAFTFGPAAVMKTQIDQGAAFDLAILTPPLADALTAAGKVDGATRATIARAGLGVAVRAGAPKPDVSTEAALKQALLAAKSIGFNGVGASRIGIEAALGKLGIAGDVKPKIVLLDVSAPVAVAKGDVEMGLGPVSEILAVSGAENAGAFPSELQSYLVMTAVVAANTKDADTAKALIRFLTAPAAGPTIKTKGMEPG